VRSTLLEFDLLEFSCKLEFKDQKSIHGSSFLLYPFMCGTTFVCIIFLDHESSGPWFPSSFIFFINNNNWTYAFGPIFFLNLLYCFINTTSFSFGFFVCNN